MRSWASFILLAVFALSPGLKEALGQIFQAEIVSGTIDQKGGLNADIEALGRQNGVLVEIRCRWVSGVPGRIVYKVLEREL